MGLNKLKGMQSTKQPCGLITTSSFTDNENRSQKVQLNFPRPHSQ